MVRRYIHVMLLLGMTLGASFVFAQEDDNGVPTVEVAFPRHTLRSEACTFSDQHFRNMRAYDFQGGDIADSGVLRDGKFERNENLDHASVDFGWLIQPRARSHAVTYAIALYSWEWAGGSSSQSHVVQVFGCKIGHLIVLQQISNDAHSERAGVSYDPDSGILVVKSVRYGSGPHCCPEKLDIVTLRWVGNKFERVRWRTVPMPNHR